MELSEKNDPLISTSAGEGDGDGGGGGGGYSIENVKRAKLNSTLAALLDDPILADVPKKPSLSDVDTLISLELGSAMRITILKLDSTSFDVVVMNSATVKDLKLCIKKKVNEMEQSKMGHRHISWKHVWANYCLLYHNEKLLNESAALQDFGIRNNSQDCETALRAARTASPSAWLGVLAKTRSATWKVSRFPTSATQAMAACHCPFLPFLVSFQAAST
uniref:SNRNP25 ubiquitin-like domain-containing protein n=1 Tax=Chenopodium quinoa TaxID=63459 RepID=A0A803MX15_CHEQI